MAVRSAAHARGLRYRVQSPPVPGVHSGPGLVFEREHVVVFVDGCSLHGCPDHGTVPVHNPTWWAERIEENRHRDRIVDEQLHRAGWIVLRVWAHEDPHAVTTRIAQTVRRQRLRRVA